MRLEISTEQHHSTATKVVLNGSLDSDTAPSLDAQLTPLLEDTHRLVFEMAELQFISSAGLRIISKAQKAMAAKDGEVVMINLQPQVEKVFEIIKALPSLSIFQSEEEMDTYLQSIQSKEAGKH